MVYDYGIKFNILRNLAESGCKVKVVPAWTSAEEVLGMNQDGIFLSNGPGDPDAVPYAKEIVQRLIGKTPSLEFASATKSWGWRWGPGLTSSSLVTMGEINR